METRHHVGPRKQRTFSLDINQICTDKGVYKATPEKENKRQAKNQRGFSYSPIYQISLIMYK